MEGGSYTVSILPRLLRRIQGIRPFRVRQGWPFTCGGTIEACLPPRRNGAAPRKTNNQAAVAVWPYRGTRDGLLRGGARDESEATIEKSSQLHETTSFGLVKGMWAAHDQVPRTDKEIHPCTRPAVIHNLYYYDLPFGTSNRHSPRNTGVSTLLTASTYLSRPASCSSVHVHVDSSPPILGISLSTGQRRSAPHPQDQRRTPRSRRYAQPKPHLSIGSIQCGHMARHADLTFVMARQARGFDSFALAPP